MRAYTKKYSGLFHRKFLGYSFKNDVYPLEDTRNPGYQLVDIENFYKDNPTYFAAMKKNMRFMLL